MSSARALLCGACLAFLAAGESAAQFNPLTIVSKAVTTSLDVRTKAEVTADTEIGAGASKRLLDDKKAEWAGVTVLVFAQHVVIAGAVKTEDVKKRVEALVKADPKIRSLKNELLVGDVASLASDTALDAEINARLTAADGVASVNMRWCTTGGRVVLMGVARSANEAKLAAATVSGIKGVKGLKSHLRVVPPAK